MVEIKIYTIANPIDNSIFYVGRCVSSIYTRLSAHISALKKGEGSKIKGRIIDEIVSTGLFPVIEEVEKLECNNAIEEMYINQIEVYWIQQFNAWGFNLCNSIGMHNYSCNNKPLIHWHKKIEKTNVRHISNAEILGLDFKKDYDPFSNPIFRSKIKP